MHLNGMQPETQESIRNGMGRGFCKGSSRGRQRKESGTASFGVMGPGVS